MTQGRCPICGKAFRGESLDDLPAFPFCSHRCKLIDLGRWIDGSYHVPGAEVLDPGEGEDPGQDGDDSG